MEFFVQNDEQTLELINIDCWDTLYIKYLFCNFVCVIMIAIVSFDFIQFWNCSFLLFHSCVVVFILWKWMSMSNNDFFVVFFLFFIFYEFYWGLFNNLALLYLWVYIKGFAVVIE